MSEELLVCLSQERICPKCQRRIPEGEYAVRKLVRETRRAPATVLFYHPDCWEVKK